MSKHTPGPWRVYEGGSEGPRILPNTGDKKEDLKYIARVDGRDFPTDLANAKLIAAAPDLLAALKAQESRNAYPPPFGHDCMWCCTCTAKLSTMRRDAIAKTEGK